jgi:hypothetical protein
LNYTPSFHYVHNETPRKLDGGFGELTEDHMDQSHQNMDKIHRGLGRLGFVTKRAMAISRLEKIATDPELIKKMASVKDERNKRKFKKPSEGVLVKKIALKKVKSERRVENLDEEMAKEKDRYIVK